MKTPYPRTATRIGRLLAIGLMVLAGLGLAATPATSPVGLWKTVSDETGRPSGIVEIVETGGVYSGRIVKLLEKDPDTVCSKCTDARKDQKVVGMVFLTGLKADGDEFNGGEILDPAKGTVYRAKMKLLDGGTKLEVRGFIGFSLLGRSQTWIREP